MSDVSRRTFVGAPGLAGMIAMAGRDAQAGVGNPADVLETILGKPACLFERFPSIRVFIGPPDGAAHHAREIH